MDIVSNVISGVENVPVQDSKNSALQPQKRFHLKKYISLQKQLTSEY
jgi:hypothetical protein